jgi:hypothetical protein
MIVDVWQDKKKEPVAAAVELAAVVESHPSVFLKKT